MRFMISVTLLAWPLMIMAAHVEELPAINVEGASQQAFKVSPDVTPASAPTAAAWLQRVPGAGVNLNGPLTGIAQYRGMYGDRVNVVMDGVNVIPGGPNAMDAPLGYLPRTRTESVQVIRGIAPVSSGNETIGGTVIANSRLSDFAPSEQWQSQGRIDLGVQSVDSGYAGSSLFGWSNDAHRLHAAVTREAGSDRRFPGGRVAASRYDRNSYDLGYGLRHDDHELSIDYRRNDTNTTGTPSLPMDIIVVDTDLLRTGYKGIWGNIGIEAQVSYNQVDHVMNNFALRPAMPGMRRATQADVEALGYQFKAFVGLAGGELGLGA
ncbi:MAG: TonB-dependent receptor plug domain-containing protein, partial [Haliea sp.]